MSRAPTTNHCPWQGTFEQPELQSPDVVGAVETNRTLHKCGLCHIACLECTGPKITDCTQCRKLKLGNSCVQDGCPFLFFEQENTKGANQCTVPNSMLAFIASLTVFLLWLCISKCVRGSWRRKQLKRNPTNDESVGGNKSTPYLAIENGYSFVTDKKLCAFTAVVDLSAHNYQPGYHEPGLQAGYRDQPQMCWFDPSDVPGVLIVSDDRPSSEDNAPQSSTSVSPSLSGYHSAPPFGSTSNTKSESVSAFTRKLSKKDVMYATHVTLQANSEGWVDETYASLTSSRSYEVTV